METARDPPKEHWTVRALAWVFRLLSSKKYHHLYTKEFFIGYAVSGQVTAVQFFALDKLITYTKPWWDSIGLHLLGWLGVLKDAIFKLVHIVLTASN